MFEIGASLKALSAATGIKALANPAVINSVTMSANTAFNGIASGDSWDKVVINTVTSALSTATGTKIGNLVGGKVTSALNNLGLSERAVSALAASSNGVSFAVTQSALEETKNAFMYGAEYKPDATSIAANIITSILFGSLEAFKNNPKAAKLQNRLKQGDVTAQKETADFLNEQAASKQDTTSYMDIPQSPDNPLLTAHEQAELYIKQWPQAQGVENSDANGYNWDGFYEGTVNSAGESLKTNDITSIYRAVGPNEYYSVVGSGKFVTIPTGMEVKQFGLHRQDTINFAEHYPNIAAVLEVKIPKGILNNIGDFTKVDTTIFKNGTVTIQPENLDTFNKYLKVILHIY